MKRLGNLYEKIYNIDNINYVYKKISSKIHNKRKLEFLKQYRCIYISRIHTTLKNKSFIPSSYNTFTIYEPKKRIIISLNLQDKIINHLVSTYILLPALTPCLIDSNVASRKGFGTRRGLELSYEYHRICKLKYKNYYILKGDISKFFQSINHNILKEKLKKKIKDISALDIVFKIIDSDSAGLSIGTMTSQILAVFYLNDLDHYIKEVLKIKYYVRYQDDFLLFHKSKQYLKYCLGKIAQFLEQEDLYLNKKTRIYSHYDNFLFLGRTQKGKYGKYRTVKRRLKKRAYLYSTQKILLANYANSIISYDYLLNKSYF